MFPDDRASSSDKEFSAHSKVMKLEVGVGATGEDQIEPDGPGLWQVGLAEIWIVPLRSGCGQTTEGAVGRLSAIRRPEYSGRLAERGNRPAR